MGPRYFGLRYWNQRFVDSVDGAYSGSRFFANRYFGLRYFGANQTSDPFELAQSQGLAGSGIGSFSSLALTYGSDKAIAQTNTLAGSGIAGITALLSYENEDWAFTPPLELTPAIGVGALACDLEFIEPTTGGAGRYFGSRYFGPRYFGPRYWSTLYGWNLEQTAGLAGVGAGTISAGIGLGIVFAPTQAFAAIGTGTYAAGLSYVDPPPVIPESEAVGFWPEYMPHKRKRKKADEPDSAEEMEAVAEVAAPQREKLTIKRARPVIQVQKVETVADKIERIAIDRAKRERKRKKDMEEKLLMMD
jgi:hypothetical protein